MRGRVITFIIGICSVAGSPVISSQETQDSSFNRALETLVAMANFGRDNPINTRSPKSTEVKEEIELKDIKSNKLPDYLKNINLENTQDITDERTLTKDIGKMPKDIFERSSYTEKEFTVLINRIAQSLRGVCQEFTNMYNSRLESTPSSFKEESLNLHSKTEATEVKMNTLENKDSDVTIKMNKNQFNLTIGGIQLVTGNPRNLTLRFTDGSLDNAKGNSPPSEYEEEILEISVEESDNLLEREDLESEDLYSLDNAEGVLIETDQKLTENSRAKRSTKKKNLRNKYKSFSHRRIPRYKVLRKRRPCYARNFKRYIKYDNDHYYDYS